VYPAALRPLRRLYGSTTAVTFSPLSLKLVRETMIKAEHCRYTINKNIGRIRRMFAWAVENELLPGHDLSIADRDQRFKGGPF